MSGDDLVRSSLLSIFLCYSLSVARLNWLWTHKTKRSLGGVSPFLSHLVITSFISKIVTPFAPISSSPLSMNLIRSCQDFAVVGVPVVGVPVSSLTCPYSATLLLVLFLQQNWNHVTSLLIIYPSTVTQDKSFIPQDKAALPPPVGQRCTVPRDQMRTLGNRTSPGLP